MGALAVHPAPSAVVGPACAYRSLWEAQHVRDPACRPDRRAPWLEFPDPVVPGGCPLPTILGRGSPLQLPQGRPSGPGASAALTPLVGSQPSGPWFPRVFPYPVGPPPPYSSLLPAPAMGAPGPHAQIGCVGSQHSAPWTPRVFPYPVEPPPPYSSAPPTPGGDTPEPGAHRGWQPPPCSARLTAVGRPSRAASHVKMTLEVLPSGGLSRFSIWAPKPLCSPELCPLPPSPCVDPQPEPQGPRPHAQAPGPAPPLLALIGAWKPCPPVLRGRGVQ